jgi:hypothetical protein
VTGKGLLGVLEVRVPDPAAGSVTVGVDRVLLQYAGSARDTLAALAPLEVPVALKGDVDGDGTLTEGDVAAVLAAAGMPVTGEAARFDLDGDGAIGPADADLLSSHLAPAARARAAALGRDADLPEAVALRAPFPNPFNAATALVFELPTASEVDLAIVNLLGQRVRQLGRGHRAAGTHRLAWDGRDDGGRPATSGAYFAVLTAAGEQRVRRVLLMR